MRKNVSDDGDMFKETKLLMYSSRKNHGYVTKTDISYAKQMILQKLFAVWIVCEETKLLMYSHSGKYGFITKTVMSYAKQRVLA